MSVRWKTVWVEKAGVLSWSLEEEVISDEEADFEFWKMVCGKAQMRLKGRLMGKESVPVSMYEVRAMPLLDQFEMSDRVLMRRLYEMVPEDRDRAEEIEGLCHRVLRFVDGSLVNLRRQVGLPDDSFDGNSAGKEKRKKMYFVPVVSVEEWNSLRGDVRVCVEHGGDKMG